MLETCQCMSNIPFSILQVQSYVILVTQLRHYRMFLVRVTFFQQCNIKRNIHRQKNIVPLLFNPFLTSTELPIDKKNSFLPEKTLKEYPRIQLYLIFIPRGKNWKIQFLFDNE